MDVIIPLLKSRKSQKEEVFKVSHFEGAEGIKLVVEKALYCQSRQWKIIAPAKNFFSDFDENYARYFLKTRRANGVKAQSLWEFKPGRRILSAEEIKERNPRYLPKTMHGKFQSVVIVFDDKVAFISSMKNLSAVLIQSREINETLAAIFSGLREGSVPIKNA
jgi:hypothetical protein